MNLKQAKRCRQTLRSYGVNWSQAEYITANCMGTIELASTCGKAVYRRMKKEYHGTL